MTTVSNRVIDRAYNIMCAELDHWQIVGPQKEQGPNGREFYTAVRKNDPVQVFASSTAKATNDTESAPATFQHFIDKAHAVACVQWHGLQAVLQDEVLQKAFTRD